MVDKSRAFFTGLARHQSFVGHGRLNKESTQLHEWLETAAIFPTVLHKYLFDYIGGCEDIRFLPCELVSNENTSRIFGDSWSGGVADRTFEDCAREWTIYNPRMYVVDGNDIKESYESIAVGIALEDFKSAQHDVNVLDALYLMPTGFRSPFSSEPMMCHRSKVAPNQNFAVKLESISFTPNRRIGMRVDVDKSTLSISVDGQDMGIIWRDIPNILKCRPYIGISSVIDCDVYVL